jgi:hypothetical protein
MTDIQPYEPPDNFIDSPIAVWADSARRAAVVAVSLAKTPFVPQSLRDPRDAGVTAANITAAILTGQEIGIQPMAALRSIDIIQGTPAMRAVALRALVQSKGHDVWVVEATKTRAVVSGRRKGSDQTQSSTWTMDRAKDLNLVSKDNWRKQPQAMLVARATSELCRLIAADVILGIPYSVEELQDGDDTADDSTPSRAAATRTARRRVVPVEVAADLEPVVEPELERVVEDESTQVAEPPEDWEPTLDIPS